MSVYLVTQAIGQQSQWVIKHLLEAGHKIHAVVRNIEKIPALLSDPSITLFQGESKNLDDIFKAALGCEAAFLNTVSFPGLMSFRPKQLSKLARRLDNKDVKAVPRLHEYYTSKYEVENIVRTGKFESYTILRPARIHYDFFIPGAYNNFLRLPTDGEIDDLLADGAKFPCTDAHDVGKYAAAALQDPTRFRGQEIDLGNELFDFEEVRNILAIVSGRGVGIVKCTPEEVENLDIGVHGHMFQHFANMKPFDFVQRGAKQVQEKFAITFTSLEDALRRDKDRLMECIPAKKEP
ncbi:hypothetical protein FAGAP_3060 [Fusarium agapanthi]|uniref:NmrA-like domain-containing protein n=1 Tax=Fusarium agapanthi TaxID=1803897 RepID=A0A9P5BGD9_9HYPO|nr:hypothetical protein FAGAP_3060 [Fusarium agapanthi]